VTTDKHRISVLCIDDHHVVRQGIALLLSLEPDLEVVATATSEREALTEFRRHQPDVTLLDLELGSMSGLEVLRAIRAENARARVIILTIHDEADNITTALRSGAATYLLKDTFAGDLVRIIREVHAGARPLPPDIAGRLASSMGQPTLTLREVAVLELAAQGLRNKEIAATLGIAELTAQTHMRNILTKLSVNDRTAAVTAGLRRGIIRLD
jgi:DNA-binding NarL/FixJ family response regulator